MDLTGLFFAAYNVAIHRLNIQVTVFLLLTEEQSPVNQSTSRSRVKSDFCSGKFNTDKQ